LILRKENNANGKQTNLNLSVFYSSSYILLQLTGARVQ